MKIKRLLVALVYGLSITHNYGNNDELNEKLGIKEEELRILSKKIAHQEQLLVSIRGRITELGISMVEAKKKKNISEGSENKVSDIELADTLDKEVQEFIKDFFTNKKISLANKLFDESNEFGLSMLQFHSLRFFFEALSLRELLSEWEGLAREVADLYNQIESLKNAQGL